MKKLPLFLVLLPARLPAQTPVAADKPINIFTLGDSNGTFAQSWPNQLELGAATNGYAV